MIQHHQCVCVAEEIDGVGSRVQCVCATQTQIDGVGSRVQCVCATQTQIDGVGSRVQCVCVWQRRLMVLDRYGRYYFVIELDCQ